MQILIAAWIVFWSRWSFTACCDADWQNTERSRLALEKPKKIKAFDWQKTECQFRKPSLEKLLTEKTERQFRKPSLEKGETETGKNWVPIYKTVSGKAWDKPMDFHDLWRRRLTGVALGWMGTGLQILLDKMLASKWTFTTWHRLGLCCAKILFSIAARIVWTFKSVAQKSSKGTETQCQKSQQL